MEDSLNNMDKILGNSYFTGIYIDEVSHFGKSKGYNVSSN